MNDHVEAWVIGTHELPQDVPAYMSIGEVGDVIVYDEHDDEWHLLDPEDFADAYEWV